MTKIIFARITPEIYTLVQQISSARGENISTFVRRAILRELARLEYLDKTREKALEVEKGRDLA